MSIQSEIARIGGNIAEAYAQVAEKGGTLPEVQNSANLPGAIAGLPASSAGPLTPEKVYQDTRPADWLPMPEPADDEMYLLFHIPDGASALLAFTVTCTGSYTVALGTVRDGAFVQSKAASVASGSKYEAELSSADWADHTDDGLFSQVMVKVSGTGILTWEPSTHSKKAAPANFAGWNIMEIACRLPNGTKVACGSDVALKSLRKLRYFTWRGGNKATNMNYMFSNCYPMKTVLELDTSHATGMDRMFNNCTSMMVLPELDTGSVTSMNYMFYNCPSLLAIPELDTSRVTAMNYMFASCAVLLALPELDTSRVTAMDYMFYNCYALLVIPKLDTGSMTAMNNTFYNCFSIGKIAFDPSVQNWAGTAISLANCSLGHKALVDFFNSLPTITSAKAITLTGNPGVSELTAAEKAIATGKNWTLTL